MFQYNLLRGSAADRLRGYYLYRKGEPTVGSGTIVAESESSYYVSCISRTGTVDIPKDAAVPHGRFYTGIGHRTASVEGKEFALWLSSKMAEKGITLLSGDARGIDSYFEQNSRGNCRIFLPYKEFGHYPGRDMSKRHVLYMDQKRFADEMVPEILEMKPDHKDYHRRNFFQAWNYGELPEVLFFYAKLDEEGKVTGGTRTAVNAARALGIPTYNFYTEEGRQEIRCLIEDL